MDARIKHWPQKDLKQVASFVNVNPEDYVAPTTAAQFCHQANQELAATVAEYADYFAAGVEMLPMNNIARPCTLPWTTTGLTMSCSAPMAQVNAGNYQRLVNEN